MPEGSSRSGSSVARRYVPAAPNADAPIVWYEGSGTSDRRWLHADRLGSIVGYSNGSDAMAAKYAYGPYGEPQSWSGSRFAYTGQLMIPEAQLYYYKARVYDPMMGHFMQTDPLGFGGGINLYGYAGGDPVNAIDPSGLHIYANPIYGGWRVCDSQGPHSGYPGDPDNGGMGDCIDVPDGAWGHNSVVAQTP